jgi:hypothetical protein
MTAYTHVPNSYQKPNVFVDEIMCLLSPTQNMVLDAACRQIMGWETKRAARRDRISLSQFETLTGLSRHTILAALAHLATANLLTPIGTPTGRTAQEYELNLGQRGDYRWDFLRDHPPYRHDPSLYVAGSSGAATEPLAEEYRCLNPPLSGAVTDELAVQSLHTPNSLNSKGDRDIDSLWKQAQALARNLMPRATFDAHLAGARLAPGDTPGAFRLLLERVESPNARVWLKTHLEPTLLYALSQFTEPVVALDFDFRRSSSDGALLPGDSHAP